MLCMIQQFNTVNSSGNEIFSHECDSADPNHTAPSLRVPTIKFPILQR